MAEVVAYQDVRFDGVGASEEGRRGSGIPIEARIVKVALDFAHLRDGGDSEAEAFGVLSQRRGWYGPAVLAGLRDVLEGGTAYEIRLCQAGQDIVPTPFITHREVGDVLRLDVVARPDVPGPDDPLHMKRELLFGHDTPAEAFNYQVPIGHDVNDEDRHRVGELAIDRIVGRPV